MKLSRWWVKSEMDFRITSLFFKGTYGVQSRFLDRFHLQVSSMFYLVKKAYKHISMPYHRIIVFLDCNCSKIDNED